MKRSLRRYAEFDHLGKQNPLGSFRVAKHRHLARDAC